MNCLKGAAKLKNTAIAPYQPQQYAIYFVCNGMMQQLLTPQILDRIIEMAWEDRTPFEAIYHQFGLLEKEVITIMRAHSKPSSFKMWRKRMSGRSTKHSHLRSQSVSRFKCSLQRTITHNKISKR